MGGLAAAILAGTVTAVLVGPGPAAAHVTVNPREATQGGYTKLTFRVPNERDNASTVKVEVNIPPETAIASVSVRPVPGWAAVVERSTLPTPLESDDGPITEAVSKITWTAAAGAAVQPGQFQEFDVSAGPLPEVDRIVFKALQTYSNGEIVRWIEEPPAAGGDEPEHPAPVLTLTKQADTADGAEAANANADLASGSDDSDTQTGWALALGLAGLIVGLAALALGGVAWRRTRRTA
jgi:uncharacterized protein YcnI